MSDILGVTRTIIGTKLNDTWEVNMRIKVFRHGAEIFWAGFIFNLLETWYFGWNLKPQSPQEMMCDYLSAGLMVAGLTLEVYATMIMRRIVKVNVVCRKRDER